MARLLMQEYLPKNAPVLAGAASIVNVFAKNLEVASVLMNQCQNWVRGEG